MRFPSLQNLRTDAHESAARFPFVILAAFVAAVAGVLFVEASNNDEWAKLYLGAQLGVPFMFAIAVAGEVRAWARSLRTGLSAGAIIALTAYAWALPGDITVVAGTRHAQFTVGLHLLVAFAPFLGVSRINGFWQYNRVLFLRFCMAILYSAVLFAGLAVALLAIDNLLGVHVRSEFYPQLWVVIAMIFNTWFFVGGIPGNIGALDGVAVYPRGLRVFAQYILVPLVIIYLGILAIYLGKVIVTRQWPSGWIGYLVSSVAVVGILAHLLVHPVRDESGSQWVRTYSRWYYVTMVPAIAMLLLAVGKRIDQYGVTEKRYLLAVLAVWLAGISVYFILSKARNIKLIPITLCLVAFGTSFGSWGAFSVSHRSQWNRLTGLLDSNGILVSESVQTPTNEVTFEDRKEISAVLDYLVSTHGTDRIAALFGDRWERIDSVGGHNRHGPIRYGGSELVQRITDQMGFTYVSRWEHLSKDGESFSLYLGPNVTVYPLHGADALVQVSMAQEPIEIAGPARTITWDRPRQAFRVSTGADTLWLDAQEWALGVMENFNGTPGYGSISIEQARMEARNERVHVIIYVQNVSGKTVDDGVEIQNLGGMCLVRWEE